jgi:nucleotide-binding universal stress UspA family protein
VLGYQGQSHTRTDHIGSVTDRIVRNAGRPVLVV